MKKETNKRKRQFIITQIISGICIVCALGMLYVLCMAIKNCGSIESWADELAIQTMPPTIQPIKTEEPIVVEETPVEEIVDEEEQLPEWSGKGEFKSFMDYRTITDSSSPQYKLQQQAWTNDEGIRCVGDYRMIALGLGHGLSVGDKIRVNLTSGEYFLAIMGEEKDPKDTLEDGIIHKDDGSIIEFIVDENKIDPNIKTGGSFHILPQFEGGIKNIVKEE
jgi:hypothetical protein